MQTWLLICFYAATANRGLGNDLSAKVCEAHKKPVYCWDPKRLQNWTKFWMTYGHEVVQSAIRQDVDPVGAAVHVRCGDILLEGRSIDPIYQYACKHCVEDALAWLSPYTHVHFVVGGHITSQQDPLKEKHRCAAMVGRYMDVFLRHKFDVTVRYTRETWKDWWFLHRAHKVLAVVPSSFSFTAKAHDLLALKIIGAHNIPPVWQHCATLPSPQN